jgi:acyl dehydratase
VPVLTPTTLRDRLGTEIGVSEWIHIDHSRIEQFAAVTEDWQWIHLDAARCAAESPFGAPVAHGFLTLAMLSRFVNAVVEVQGASHIVAAGLTAVRFIGPVRAGSNVRGRVRLRECMEGEGYVQVTWRVTVEVEHQRHPVMTADWAVRYTLDANEVLDRA